MDPADRPDRPDDGPADVAAEITADVADPGWYPDPGHPAVVRFWDGSAWTEHVRPDTAVTALRRRRPVWETVAIVVLITLGVVGLAGVVFVLMLVKALDDWGENK